MNNYFQFLKNVYFFNGLNDEDIKRMLMLCHEATYQTSEIIFEEGSKADNFYIVTQGAVEVWKDYKDPERDLLAVHETGHLFGEMSLIDELPRSATVIARGTTKLLYINRDDFHNIIMENSSITLSIMKSVSSMVRKSNETFVEGLRQRNRKLKRAYQKLKDAQEELLKSERLSTLGKFSSLILHDIRNPLSILRSYAELILFHVDDQGRIKRNAQKIIGEADRLNQLTSELLDFSKGEIRLNMSIVDLKSFFSGLIDKVSDKFHAREMTIETHIQYNPPLIIDVDRMTRVFLNLFDNARKAMSKGGILSISAATQGNFLCIKVKDTGIGMSNSVQKRIFEPFFSYSTRGGTGLGMSIVKSVVEAHDGSLSVSSRKSEGTIITILLPVVE